MSTLIVEICTVDKVRKHGNADKLSLVTIKGWQCVVPKDRYKVGDLVTYVPIDAVVPVALSDQLEVTKYLSKGRVRCARLRGEPSYGLIFDNEHQLPAGTDVAERYGIIKWVAPIRDTQGDATSEHPLFPTYTEIENLLNFPTAIEHGERVVVTEKVHGRNVRVGLVDGVLMAGSHHVRRKYPINASNQAWRDFLARLPFFGKYFRVMERSESIYAYPLGMEKVVALLNDVTVIRQARVVILYGELYGPRMQDFDYGVKQGQIGFRAFDLMVDGVYLDHEEFVRFCAMNGVERVPTLLCEKFDLEIIKKLAEGKSNIGGEHVREGVVVKLQTEGHNEKIGRVILKCLNPDYLSGTSTDRGE